MDKTTQHHSEGNRAHQHALLMRAEIPLGGNQNERAGGDREIKSSQQTRCRSQRRNGVVDELAVFNFFRPLCELLLDGCAESCLYFRERSFEIRRKPKRRNRATAGEDKRSPKFVRQEIKRAGDARPSKSQCDATAMLIAKPRKCSGQTSDTVTHAIGPMPTAKKAMKTNSPAVAVSFPTESRLEPGQVRPRAGKGQPTCQAREVSKSGRRPTRSISAMASKVTRQLTTTKRKRVALGEDRYNSSSSRAHNKGPY